MTRFSVSPKELVFSFWRNRGLVTLLVRKETAERYRGSVFGILWSLLHPALMLAIYTVFFGVVLESRWGLPNESRSDFALVLFSGLIAFNIFSECVNRAPTLVAANASYVKKIVFPLEILSFVAVGSAMFQAAAGLGAWCVAYLVIKGAPFATGLWLPAVLAPLVLFVLGLTWALSVVGAYFRDIAPVTGILTTAFLFFSPVFYSLSAVPAGVRPFVMLNPMTPILENIRNILCRGVPPDWRLYGMSLAVGAATAWGGFVLFQRARRGFADVV